MSVFSVRFLTKQKCIVCNLWATASVWQWHCFRFVVLHVTSCTHLVRQTHQLTQMFKSQTSFSWVLFLVPSCLFGHQPASWEESTRGKSDACLLRKPIYHIFFASLSKADIPVTPHIVLGVFKLKGSKTEFSRYNSSSVNSYSSAYLTSHLGGGNC